MVMWKTRETGGNALYRRSDEEVDQGRIVFYTLLSSSARNPPKIHRIGGGKGVRTTSSCNCSSGVPSLRPIRFPAEQIIKTMALGEKGEEGISKTLKLH